MTLLYASDEPTQSPLVTEETIRAILREEYGILNAKIIELTGYEDCNMRLESLEYDEKLVKNREDLPESAILKVTNPIEARHRQHIELQHLIYKTFRGAGIPTVRPIRRVDDSLWGSAEIFPGLQLPVRLFEMLPGQNLENFDFNPDLCFKIGALLARVHKCFDSMNLKKTPESHVPFISPENRDCLVRESKILVLKKMLTKDRFDLAMAIFGDFHEKILNRADPVDYGLIHSDFNETNLLIEERNGELEISGVLDFGDMHFSERVFDVAASILYLHLSDRLNQGIEKIQMNILEGYRSERRFDDCQMLRVAMRARLVCSLIYGLRTARLNVRKSSTEYVLRTQSNGWRILTEELANELLPVASYPFV